MLNKKQKESRLQKLTAKGRSRTGKSQRSTKNDIRRKQPAGIEQTDKSGSIEQLWWQKANQKKKKKKNRKQTGEDTEELERKSILKDTIVGTPTPFSAWGLSLCPNFAKGEGRLDRISIFREGCMERGGEADVFQGVAVFI